jgi:hypothetical protein
MYLPRLYTSFTEYDPVEKEPLLFVAFADLGRAVWEAYDGECLDPGWLRPDIPKHLRQKAKAFIERFGSPLFSPKDVYFTSPLNSNDEFDIRGLTFFSLQTLMREAQLMTIAVSYSRFITFQEDLSVLARYITSYIHLMDEGEEWRRRRLIGNIDLSTDEGVVEATELMIERFQREDRRFGGLKFDVERRTEKGKPTQWSTVFYFDSLLNVMWMQLHRAIEQRSELRTCRNARCPKPLLLFQPDRSDQRFCEKRCRDAHSAREYRRRHPSGR